MVRKEVVYSLQLQWLVVHQSHETADVPGLVLEGPLRVLLQLVLVQRHEDGVETLLDALDGVVQVPLPALEALVLRGVVMRLNDLAPAGGVGQELTLLAAVDGGVLGVLLERLCHAGVLGLRLRQRPHLPQGLEASGLPLDVAVLAAPRPFLAPRNRVVFYRVYFMFVSVWLTCFCCLLSFSAQGRVKPKLRIYLLAKLRVQRPRPTNYALKLGPETYDFFTTRFSKKVAMFGRPGERKKGVVAKGVIVKLGCSQPRVSAGELRRLYLLYVCCCTLVYSFHDLARFAMTPLTMTPVVFVTGHAQPG